MKSIEDTLKLVKGIQKALQKTCSIDIALAGGYAVISHGVGRTTVDVDFYLYSDLIKENSKTFFERLKKAVPSQFKIELIEGTKMTEDPFPYDIAFITDKKGEYPRLDFIVAKYKWELEGIQAAKPLEDIPFPVLPIPYLITSKLKAGSPKDDSDIIELYKLMSKKEQNFTIELSRKIRRDKKLESLINPQIPPADSEDPSQLL